MSSTVTCAITGATVDAQECAEIILGATQELAAKCSTCPRPQGQVSMPTDSPRLCAWDRIQQATGIHCKSKLVAKIGCTMEHFSGQLARLDAGKLPRINNTFVPALLQLTGLRLCDFIPGAPNTWDPADAGDSAAISSAFGPLAESAAPILDPAGAPVHIPAGDLAADLANPATIEHMPGQDRPMLMTKDEFEAEAAAELLTQARAQAAPEDTDDEWQEYTGRAPSKPSTPHLCIDKNGKLGLTVAAVRDFGVSHGHWVDLLWNAPRRQIGIRVLSEQGRASLRVSGNPKCSRHQFHGAGFWAQFGLAPKPGQYPLHRAPSGLLVATIELENQEAKAS